MSNGSLRRAAILISSLDTESADALLDEMSADQAAAVRNAIMELGDIDIVEQQEAIERFVGNNPQAAKQIEAGVEIDADLARKFEAADPQAPEQTVGNTPASPAEGQRDRRPFAFLDQVESSDLARVLSGEHPQTTATVVAHLAPDHAAEVLGHLPREGQTETLMRIARLSTPHPDVVRDLEQEMQSRLANRPPREQVGANGLATVEAILQNTAAATRQDLVTDLAQKDQVLVRQLRVTVPIEHTDNPAHPPTTTPLEESGLPAARHALPEQYQSESTFTSSRATLEFAELECLENSDLAQILQRCSSNTTLLALAGASHQFVKRIMSQLPAREAKQLQRKIDNIGPLRLDDVQRAQQQLAAIAQQLIDEGSLIAPGLNALGKPRLSVAA